MQTDECWKPLLYHDSSKMLITCLSVGRVWPSVIYSFIPALCLPHKVSVLVKVETLQPLESIAVNNVPSCFGNDNWKKNNTSSVFCFSTLSRCRVNLCMLDFQFHLDVHTAFKEVTRKVLLWKNTWELWSFWNDVHACVPLSSNNNLNH